MTNFNYANLDPGRREHFVYRCYDASGALLYVGRTINLSKRLVEHRRDGRSRRWLGDVDSVKLFGPTSYETAKRVELAAIHAEAPLHNVHGNPHRPRITIETIRAARSRVNGETV